LTEKTTTKLVAENIGSLANRERVTNHSISSKKKRWLEDLRIRRDGVVLKLEIFEPNHDGDMLGF
jgi:hypothetical protein